MLKFVGDNCENGRPIAVDADQDCGSSFMKFIGNGDARQSSVCSGQVCQMEGIPSIEVCQKGWTKREGIMEKGKSLSVGLLVKLAEGGGTGPDVADEFHETVQKTCERQILLKRPSRRLERRFPEQPRTQVDFHAPPCTQRQNVYNCQPATS